MPQAKALGVQCELLAAADASQRLPLCTVPHSSIREHSWKSISPTPATADLHGLTCFGHSTLGRYEQM